jgi:putative PIN family toxin of toxin-antitoxin system
VLKRDSLPAMVFRRVVEEDQALLSAGLKAELLDVFGRPKFDKSISVENRMIFLTRFFDYVEMVAPKVRVYDCVDVKDNKVLELALAGNAVLIISGDSHLVRLHPWRGIPILTPAQYLALDDENDLP